MEKSSSVFLGILEHKHKIEDLEEDSDSKQWEEDGWNLLWLRTDRRNSKPSIVIESYSLIPTKNHSLSELY